jgi:hypothetical protein
MTIKVSTVATIMIHG